MRVQGLITYSPNQITRRQGEKNVGVGIAVVVVGAVPPWTSRRAACVAAMHVKDIENSVCTA